MEEFPNPESSKEEQLSEEQFELFDEDELIDPDKNIRKLNEMIKEADERAAREAKEKKKAKKKRKTA